MRPFVPTNHPAFGLANATDQNPITPGREYQVVPSSGVQAAPPALAVTTTVLLPSPLPTPCAYAKPKIAPVTGGGFVSVQVAPPSLDVAVLALFGSLGSRSPPPTMPFHGLRNAIVNPPALDELNSGVSYAFHVSPPSLVASTRAIVETPVTIHAFCPPCVATHVPLAANDPSSGKAGGILPLILCHVVPSVLRRSGNTPFTESLCARPR